MKYCTYRNEEIIGENRNRQDINKLPPQKAGIEKSRLIDQAPVYMRLHTNSDDPKNDEPHNHSTLNIVCNERNSETANCCDKKLAGLSVNSEGDSLYTYRWLSQHIPLSQRAVRLILS